MCLGRAMRPRPAIDWGGTEGNTWAHSSAKKRGEKISACCSVAAGAGDWLPNSPKAEILDRPRPPDLARKVHPNQHLEHVSLCLGRQLSAGVVRRASGGPQRALSKTSAGGKEFWFLQCFCSFRPSSSRSQSSHCFTSRMIDEAPRWRRR